MAFNRAAAACASVHNLIRFFLQSARVAVAADSSRRCVDRFVIDCDRAPIQLRAAAAASSPRRKRHDDQVEVCLHWRAICDVAAYKFSGLRFAMSRSALLPVIIVLWPAVPNVLVIVYSCTKVKKTHSLTQMQQRCCCAPPFT